LKDSKNIDIFLWSKLKEGNTSAISDLYNKYIDELFRYGIQFTTDKTEVMDSIHDLFLSLYKYRKRLADTNNVQYYLLRCLKNEILKKSKNNIFKSSLPLDENMQNSQFYSSIEDTLIAKEISNDKVFQLNLALNSLNKKQRYVLFLKFNEEKKYSEIAIILGVSIETVRTIIYRAIKKLRKNLLTFILVFSNFF
jgi:RNA polymerase sigma factor (sigma-70 family)